MNPYSVVNFGLFVGWLWSFLFNGTIWPAIRQWQNDRFEREKKAADEARYDVEQGPYR